MSIKKSQKIQIVPRFSQYTEISIICEGVNSMIIIYHHILKSDPAGLLFICCAVVVINVCYTHWQPWWEVIIINL